MRGLQRTNEDEFQGALCGSAIVVLQQPAHCNVRKVTPNGVITTLAGTTVGGFNGDARPANTAAISKPAGIAVAPSGDIYIADTGNNRIRRIDRNGMIWNVAGILDAGSSVSRPSKVAHRPFRAVMPVVRREIVAGEAGGWNED